MILTRRIFRDGENVEEVVRMECENLLVRSLQTARVFCSGWLCSVFHCALADAAIPICCVMH